MLSECCENKLEITGNRDLIVKFIDENCDNYILDYKKCCNHSLLTDDISCLSSEECSLRFQIWGTLYNLREVIKIGLGHYFSIDLSAEKVVFKFATISFPPRIWLAKVGFKYTDLNFNLLYSQHRHYPFTSRSIPSMSRLKSSGILKFRLGQSSAMTIGVPGEYYDNHCQWCGRIVKIFRNQLNTCVYCKIFAYHTISSYVLKYKIRKVQKKIALSRMGRNLIMNMYLVRKVFAPRLNGCGVDIG